MTMDAHYERYCLRILDRYSVKPNEVVAHTYESERDRWTAWMADSILYAIAEMRRTRGTDWRVVLRCWGQAKEYAGRLGGFPDPYLSDACAALQNILESRIEGGKT